MHRTFRSLITLVIALSILIAVPISAGARGPETPQPILRSAEGWVSAALGWLQDALTVGRPASHRHYSASPGGIQTKDGPPPPGGSCIDPQGDRYPPPCNRP
jgi:hypothetical protein